MKSGVRSAALIVTVLAAAFGATVPLAAAQSEEKPTATEVGVTGKEIRIAVIADVDNAVIPGLFQGSVDGIRGFAKYINAKGGLAGRKVVVDFIDSKLSPDEACNAIVRACEEDFAMVGTSAVLLDERRRADRLRRPGRRGDRPA